MCYQVITFTFPLYTEYYLLVIIEKSSQANSQSNDVDNRPNETVLSADNIQLVDTSLYNLEVGSVIQFGEPPRYGVIKWIGNLPDQAEVSAGLEMVWKE